MTNWPFSNLRLGLRVAVKLKSVSVQCRTESTVSFVNATMPWFPIVDSEAVRRLALSKRQAAIPILKIEFKRTKTPSLPVRPQQDYLRNWANDQGRPRHRT